MIAKRPSLAKNTINNTMILTLVLYNNNSIANIVRKSLRLKVLKISMKVAIKEV